MTIPHHPSPVFTILPDAALTGPIGAHNPASFLRFHPEVVIICDMPASRLLPRTLVADHA